MVKSPSHRSKASSTTQNEPASSRVADPDGGPLAPGGDALPGQAEAHIPSQGTGPARSTRGDRPVKSTTVDGAAFRPDTGQVGGHPVAEDRPSPAASSAAGPARAVGAGHRQRARARPGGRARPDGRARGGPPSPGRGCPPSPGRPGTRPTTSVSAPGQCRSAARRAGPASTPTRAACSMEAARIGIALTAGRPLRAKRAATASRRRDRRPARRRCRWEGRPRRPPAEGGHRPGHVVGRGKAHRQHGAPLRATRNRGRPARSGRTSRS